MHIIHENDNYTIVAFVWANKHGLCWQCGLPAAFHAYVYAADDQCEAACAVCAANAAAEGSRIERIEELD